MESIKSEHLPEISAKDFINLAADVLAFEEESLTEAFTEVNADYGEDFEDQTLEGLFSSDNLTRFFDDESIADKEWMSRQVREISRLCNELKTATDDESKKETSRELVDYLLNV